MAMSSEKNVFTEFKNKTEALASATQSKYITIELALSVIVEEFDSVYTNILKYSNLDLRDFLKNNIKKTHVHNNHNQKTSSLDFLTLLRTLSREEPSQITEMKIFLAICRIINAKKSSATYAAVNEHVCQPLDLIDMTIKLISDDESLDDTDDSNTPPCIGLGDVIDKITTIAKSNLGMFIEINAPSMSGKTELINNLLRQLSGSSKSKKPLLISTADTPESMTGFGTSPVSKLIIIDDLDTKSVIEKSAIREVRNNNSMVICTTTVPLDNNNFSNISGNKRMLIDINQYTRDEIFEIFEKVTSKGESYFNELYSRLKQSSHCLIGEFFRTNSIVDTINSTNETTPLKDQISLAINYLYSSELDDPKQIIETIKDVEQNVKNNVVGQDDSIRLIANVIKRSALGFNVNPHRPNAVFALVGESGVGKTETALNFAKELGYELLVLNMGECHSSSYINKLIGAPSGYVGFDKGDGVLYEHISKNKKTVIVLDEIEKADSKIADLFLSCFDRGVITTASGKDIIFKDTIFFLTSNAGVSIKESPIGLTKLSSAPSFNFNLADFKSNFRPEFINRLTSIVEFKPLSEESILKIARRSIIKVLENASEKLGYQFTITDAAISHIINGCETSGARQVEREMETSVGDLVFKHIARGGVTKCNINIDISNGSLSIG